MSNRLPPAWAKHLKTQSAKKAVSLTAALPKAQPPTIAMSRTHADDMLLRQALELR